MLFNSIEFFIFFPIVVLGYYLIPQKQRHIWLLLANYYFYMCWNPAYALLLGFVTGITYLAGLLLRRIGRKEAAEPKEGTAQEEERSGKTVGGKGRRAVVAGVFILCLGLLFFFKYFEFVLRSILPVINAFYPQGGLAGPVFDIVLPVGISFYTFQALGYVMDVYREKIETESSFLRYAVFVSFFPQLASGPIERYGNMRRQFEEKHPFVPENVRDGLLLMLWGFFQKLVIADRLAILVNQVFDHYQEYNGLPILTAMLFFAIQIYCDFGGYSCIAIGAAQVMGFRLMKNFDCPYLAQSVAGFWRRWHISLTSWFTDYLYIPLGGSRCGRKKRYRNIMAVFLTSGLWHGASWHFVVWGGLNGLFQVIGYELKPTKELLMRKLHVDEGVFSHKLLKVVSTFILVDIAWVFFRANTVLDGILMLVRGVTGFSLVPLFDGSLYTLGLSGLEFAIAVAAMLVLFAVDYMHYRGRHIRQSLAGQGAWFRYAAYLAVIFVVLIFGVYGPSFDASQFIYFNF